MKNPSGGCRTCKIRRIKCDETRPTCQRCIKSRRLCIRATLSRADFLIHIENRYASGETKRPRGPRSSLTPALHPDLQTRAVAYYLNYYLWMPADVQHLPGSLTDCIVERVSETTPPILDLAVSAMALVLFARTQRHPVAAAEARVQYDKLLRHAHLTLSSLVETNIDAALLAVFLMGRYEDSAHGEGDFLSNSVFNSYLHHDGATAILQIWRQHQSREKQPATSTVKYSRRGIIRSALLRFFAMPEWLEDGCLFGESGRDLEYDRILVHIANLRNQVRAFQRDNFQLESVGPELFQAAQKLQNEAERLDNALQRWAFEIPTSWHPCRHLILTTSSFPTRDFFSAEVYSYSSIFCAVMWLNYSATRLLLNQAWLKTLELVQSRPDDSACSQQVEECRSRILATASDVSSSIPFVLGRFQAINGGEHRTVVTLYTDSEINPYVASLTAWPLSIASCIGSLGVEQKQWFGAHLAFIGTILGSGVLEHVATDEILDL